MCQIFRHLPDYCCEFVALLLCPCICIAFVFATFLQLCRGNTGHPKPQKNDLIFSQYCSIDKNDVTNKLLRSNSGLNVCEVNVSG